MTSQEMAQLVVPFRDLDGTELARIATESSGYEAFDLLYSAPTMAEARERFTVLCDDPDACLDYAMRNVDIFSVDVDGTLFIFEAH